MQVSTDQKLLRLIKITPVLVVMIFAVLVNIFVIQDNRTQVKKDTENLRSDFLEQQREQIKAQIDQVYRQIEYAKANTENQLKQTIRERIHEAHRIAETIYQRNWDKPEAEVTRLITDALRSIRFNEGRGYFFIYKTTGENVMHPLLPQMEGTSKWDLQDVRGSYIVREMGAKVKQLGEAYYRWWFVKPSDKTKEFKKIGFGKYFEPYDWFIGTGEYVVDVENDIKANLLDRINSIRFGDNSYIFVFDYQGHVLAHALRDTIGSNQLAERDSSGQPFIQNLIQTAREGGGYVRYINPYTPSTGEAADKLSYVRGIEDWQWALGTGIYLQEIEAYLGQREQQILQQNSDNLTKLLVLSFLVTAIVLLFSLSLSKNIAHRFNKLQHRISNDFNELEQTKNQMQQMAQHDALTELPNRLLLTQQIQQSIELSDKDHQQLAVMFVDLDDFKKINDLYGHSTGDKLLQAISHQFAALIGKGDSVARFGGDEFVFCFPQLTSHNDALNRVELIKQVFAQPFEIDGKQLYSSCSIGVAMYPADSDNPEELISKADIVLYKSKARQKGDVLFFDQSINEQVQHDFLLEEELRHALSRDEFYLTYQPQHLIDGDQLHGVEVLLRWNNQSLGQVPPFEFIPLAEDTGLIHEIGLFVIEHACRDIAKFNAEQGQQIQLSINLSPKQLIAKDFINQLVKRVDCTGLSYQSITLEITENVLISDLVAVTPVLQQLRDLGFSISLDDFGTGYSSLSYLNTLPINEIKIDRSFINKLLSSDQSDSLVKTIIAIGASCHMKVVAEGVETNEQLQRLAQYRCDIAQGYLLAQPLKFEQLCERYPSSQSAINSPA
ncbi:EAL domain-containing protein [Motiliproteus coralliicola]|uniref:EAL domain-containing protein n=1 Tax=Motiliproteus coralliicola TaxID=2283196 RepID=A0A369WM46_9GAMM|nr:cache domain-containing protein [Motiliproteus coralliicola]RDE22747.1 EAL domain-containing protein [Motiliproteus coralliicola]